MDQRHRDQTVTAKQAALKRKQYFGPEKRFAN